MSRRSKFAYFIVVLSLLITLIPTSAYSDHFNQVFQAESGTYSGGVVTATTHAGFNGTGFADYPTTTGAGVKITWTVNVPSAGAYTLTFRYALENGSRPLNAYINGTSVGTANFGATGSFTNWQTASVGGNMVAGNNTVELRADAGSVGPNVDEMRVVHGTPPGGTAGVYPNQTYTSSQLYQRIGPIMSLGKHFNMPSAINGYLFLGGNAQHEIWDIRNPTSPVRRSTLNSSHASGEAESHQNSFAKYPNGRIYAATVSGRGIDIWDITNAASPIYVRAVLLESINYGDNTNAVWGISWQGNYIYVGGTNTGVHIVDASNPATAFVVGRHATSKYCNVSAGPIYAMGNILMYGTPKENRGVVTIDIRNPADPRLLDCEATGNNSYFSGFFGRNFHLLSPFRTYDMLTDPSNIRLIGSDANHPPAEYMNFDEGKLFMGLLRGSVNGVGGVRIYNIANPSSIQLLAHITGRSQTNTDDQFPIPIGNLLVISDEEAAMGSWMAPIATARDTNPPTLLHVEPKNNSTGNPTATRIGLSFNSQVELTSFSNATLIVRPVGGAQISGKWGYSGTVVNFWPDSPLQNNTQYEVILPAGGVTDLVGNAITAQFRSTFTVGTAPQTNVCVINNLTPTAVGSSVNFSAVNPNTVDYTYSWAFGDGGTATGTSTNRTFSTAGRYNVLLRATPRAGGTPTTCSKMQIIHRSLTSTKPTASSSVAVDESGGRVWTVNPDTNTVTAVNISTRTKAFEVGVGVAPRTLARAPNGNIWVVNQDSANISVLSNSNGALLATVGLPRGSKPYGIAFSPDGLNAYVTLQATGRLVKFNASTRAILGTLNLPVVSGLIPEVRGVAVTADSSTVLVTRFVSPSNRGEVYRVNASSLTVTSTIALANSTTTDGPDGGRGIPNYISSLVISPDGVDVWVPSKQDNMSRGTFRDGVALSHDNTVRPITSRINLSTGTEVLANRVDHNDANMPFAAASSAFGDLVFVTLMGNNLVDVVDAYTRSIIATVNVGTAPQGLGLDSSGRLYVQNFMGRSMSIIDVSRILDGSDNTGTTLATVNLVASETLSATVLRGKRLFYSAERRMTNEGYVTCASCHLDGGQDGRVWDFTDRGEGFRNSATLLGRAGVGMGPVHWTGNFDEIQDFENDIRNEFGGTGLMTNADFTATSDPLGARKTGRSIDLDAMAAYVSSLNTVGSSPYRNSDGSLTADATAGRTLFQSLNCGTCHSGAGFTDSALNVLHNVGTIQANSGRRRNQTLTGLDTPTLKGLWDTAPYLHNGAANTLHDVINNPSHGNASGLSTTDKSRLVAYLLSIDDSGAASNQVFQAESGTYAGGVVTANNHAGFNGSGFADYPTTTGAGVKITWTVNAPSAGNYTFAFRYGLETGSRPLNLYVNGALIGTVNFVATGAFTTWSTVSVSGSMAAGNNTVELRADAGSVGPNVDEMRVSN